MADEVIMARGQFFLYSDYLALVNTCFLETVGALVPNGSSIRRVARALTSMKTEPARAKLLEKVIKRLPTTFTPILALEAHARYGPPIAEFP